MNTITGTYFDGQVAHGRAVAVEFADTGVLRLSGEGLAQEVPVSDIRVSDRLGEVPRFIYLPDGAVIETPDNATIDVALGERQQGRGSRLIHALETQRSIAAVACVVLAIAIVALGFFGPPALARWVVKRVPPDIDQRIGTAALTTIRPYFRSSSLTDAERYRVQKQLVRLQADTGVPHPRLEFLSMNGDLPNAFALPGNVIIVTDALVQLPATDDEIAAVLAHELGHLQKRHGLQSLLRSSFAVLIVAAVTGDLSALTSFASTIPLTILTAGYSRDLEREADRYALDLLRARGIKPRAFVTALVKLEAAYDSLQRGSTYFSTHPSTDERTALFDGITPAERKAVLAEPELDRATEALKQHNYQTAINHFTRVIELVPSARAYADRAKCYYDRNEYASAEADVAKALALDPKLADAYATRTEILAVGQRKFDEALVAAIQTLDLDPKNFIATATRGYAQTQKGDYKAALVDLNRAVELGPSDFRGWAYRGFLKERQNDVPGALADFDRAIKLNPDVEWIHFDRGTLRVRQKDFAGGLSDLTVVTDPTRHTADYYYYRGMAEHGVGKLDVAIADYSRTLDNKPNDFTRQLAHMNRGFAYVAAGDYRSAIADLDIAIKTAPKKDGNTYFQRAFARRRSGNAAGALADLDQAAQAGTDATAIARERAEVNWDLENYPEATRNFDRVLEKGRDAHAFEARGLLAFSLGDLEHAEADLNSYMAIGRRRSAEYVEFFLLLTRRSRKEDDQVEKFASTVATWPRGWARSVGWYLGGQTTEAELLAETNEGDTPPRIERLCEAYFYIGMTHLLADDRATAEDFFRKCVGTGVTNYYEYKLARAELKRLDPEWIRRNPPRPVEASPAPAASATAHGSSPAPTGRDMLPQVVLQTRPQYPADMRRDKVEGQVLVDFLVDSDGTVQNPYVVNSTRKEFEAAALAAVEQWKFRPAQKNSQPVATHMQVPIVFTLDEPPAASSAKP